MNTFLIVVHVIVSAVLVIVILLQAGKGSGLGGAFGGSSQAVFGGRGAQTFLGKVTSASAAVFMLTSPSLSYLSTRSGSVVKEAPAPVAYSQVMGFTVHYYEVTTANRLHYSLSDEQGNLLDDADASGENKNGEEGWGFYPVAYSVPENTILSFVLEVYESTDEDAPRTSSSRLSFNCTTGEIVSQSFERS